MAIQNIVVKKCTPFVRITGIVAGYTLLALSVLITYDVIARALFGASVGSNEIGGYVVAIVAAFGFTVALLERDHIRIDIFYRLVPASWRVVSNLLSNLGLFLYASFIAWRGWASLQESIEYGSAATTPLHTPQWIPQLIWFVGLAIFALLALIMLVHSIILLLQGKTVKSMLFYGPPSLREEIKESSFSIESLDEQPDVDANPSLDNR